MQIEQLNTIAEQHPAIQLLKKRIAVHGGGHILLTGLHASAKSIVLNAISNQQKEVKSKSEEQRKSGRIWFVIMDNQDDAQYLYADLRNLNNKGILYFPNSHRRRQGEDEALLIQRTEVLTVLSGEGSGGPVKGEGMKGERMIVVTYPEAIAEPVPTEEKLTTNTLHIRVGEERPITPLTDKLAEMGFTRVDFVYEPGQYAIRGGIVDIYSYSHELPYRLDFFGDEIDSIREFDIETQLSKQKIEHIEICQMAELQRNEVEKEQHYITEYLPADSIWVSNDWHMVQFRLNSTQSCDHLTQDHLTLEINSKSSFDNYDQIRFDTLPQPVFHKNFDLLYEDIKSKTEDGYTICILAEQKKQTDRLQSILESLDGDEQEQAVAKFVPIGQTLHAGFVDHDLKICCYTDHEIFERFHRVTLKTEEARKGKAIITLKEINQLRLGDYVVHSDHGIGTFGGLVTTTVNGKPQEMIKLIYRDGDTIFVSIHNLHRITKYKGREGSQPTISRIGSGAWERLKERTKDKVKDIARDLIRLYATRKHQKGYCYSPDGYLQHELEASFLYEDTPDQAKATLEVKKDMESPMPMDRLICGDVGFGKTEIALRAAFKAATDGRQVAVLVPTTVLALQHYNTFKERFKNFPVTVEYLTRGKTAAETKDILERLKEGKIEILIGTHKLVGKQVVWKDLGLLIIDEEQKFGVAVKEKLKSLRANIDVLTLTATPIPRTLQFSLLGARDLSVMTTPPPNRYPVQTELITMEDEDIVKEAIQLEMERNGQVFVVNNRIEMLPRIENRIRRLCPEARIAVAHGQMPTDEMEQILEDFINYEYDILISTTIIESGVDIPNVNTIIIYSANTYGLSDLHQLRGRVGRSNRKAYCYLIAPNRELLTEDAKRRLDAISTFADLGAGFNLAMQDLDIRGAGNLLGAEQSGFIADLGYETYQRILNEAVEELKDEMNIEAEEDDSNPRETNEKWCSDSQLESDLQLGFPSDYIENISERITLYRELDNLKNEDELTEYRKRLIDRFGNLPDAADELLNVVRLRWICCELGIEKVFLKKERLVLYFTTKSQKYWQSETFDRFLHYVCSRADRCQFHEDKDKQGRPTGKRYITIQQVKTLAGAINLLTKIKT